LSAARTELCTPIRSASGDAKQRISGGVRGLTAEIVGGMLWLRLTQQHDDGPRRLYESPCVRVEAGDAMLDPKQGGRAEVPEAGRAGPGAKALPL
jgi:hypothetical protein